MLNPAIPYRYGMIALPYDTVALVLLYGGCHTVRMNII